MKAGLVAPSYYDTIALGSHRALLALAALVYVAWYYIVIALFSETHDTLGERIVVAGVIFGALSATWVSEVARRYTAETRLALVMLMTAHMTIFVGRNGAHELFVVLYLVTMICCAAALSRKRHLAIYGAFALLTQAILMPHTTTPFILLGASTMTTMTVAYFTLTGRADARGEAAAKGAIIEAAQDAIVAADLSGAIVEFNPSAERLFGLRRSDVIGKMLVDVIVPENQRAAHRKAYDRFASTRKGTIVNQRLEFHGRHADGTEIPLELTITPVTLKGELLVVSFMRDVSAQHRANLTIENQKALLAESARLSALGEMAANLAHEINNPLMIIIGRARHLKKAIVAHGGGLTTEWEEVLGKIEATGERIARIVHGLRATARQADQDPFEQVSVASIFDNVVAICGERLKDNGVELSAHCQSEIWIHCREAQICQVLINLIENARAAVLPRDERWIRLEARRVGEAAEIRVIDSGAGLSPEVQAKLFTPFFTTKTSGKGTGLGLSLSRRIAEDHGGALNFDAASRHTEFVLTLSTRALDERAA